MPQVGVAFDHEEHTLGICAAGVVLRDLLGNDVAISVPVPAQRFHEQREADRRAAAGHAASAGRASQRRGSVSSTIACAARARVYAPAIQTYHMMGQAAARRCDPREACLGQENPWRHVRGEPQQQHGARVLQPVASLRLPVAELAVFRGRQDRAHPLHGEVGRAVAAHHHLDAQHHAYRRAGARGAGHAVHRRGAAAAFLRLRHRGVDPEEEMGADHLRRSGEGRRQDRAPARRGASSIPAGTTSTRTARTISATRRAS